MQIFFSSSSMLSNLHVHFANHTILSCKDNNMLMINTWKSNLEFIWLDLLKDKSPGIKSNQSITLNKFNFLCNCQISVTFLKMYGFVIVKYSNFWQIGYTACAYRLIFHTLKIYDKLFVLYTWPKTIKIICFFREIVKISSKGIIRYQTSASLLPNGFVHFRKRFIHCQVIGWKTCILYLCGVNC